MVPIDYLVISEMVACSSLIHFFHFILIAYNYFSIMTMLNFVIPLDLKSTNTNLVSILLLISYIMLAIGVFYYSLCNLRPLYCTRVNQTQLLALVKWSYIRKYSMNKILEPFVRDVAVLVSESDLFAYNYFNCIQKSGHNFCIQGYPEVMYGILVGVLADNPATCSIGGFKESCSAYWPCRQCNI